MSQCVAAVSFFKAPLLRRLNLLKHRVNGVYIGFGRDVYSDQSRVGSFVGTAKSAERFKHLRKSRIFHCLRQKNSICRVPTRCGRTGYNMTPVYFGRADHVLFAESIGKDGNIPKSVQPFTESFSPECFGLGVIVPKLDNHLI